MEPRDLGVGGFDYRQKIRFRPIRDCSIFSGTATRRRRIAPI